MSTKKIFAYLYKGEFHAEHLVEDLEEDFSNLEYGDVAEGEYQIWEYPSGKIFSVESDREVTQNKYYYAPPAKNLWQPKLTYLETDKAKVAAAYERLTNPPKRESIFKRISKSLRRGKA